MFYWSIACIDKSSQTLMQSSVNVHKVKAVVPRPWNRLLPGNHRPPWYKPLGTTVPNVTTTGLVSYWGVLPASEIYINVIIQNVLSLPLLLAEHCLCDLSLLLYVTILCTFSVLYSILLNEKSIILTMLLWAFLWVSCREHFFLYTPHSGTSGAYGNHL